MNSTPFRRLLDAACRIYTLCPLLLCVFQMLFAKEDTVIFPLSFFMLFPFALCFAGANLLLHTTAGSPGMRFLGHFALTTAGLLLFVFLPAGVFASGSSALVLIFVYLLLYFLTMLAISAARAALSRRKTEQSNRYTAQYSKK